jgi:hypothetical protein
MGFSRVSISTKRPLPLFHDPAAVPSPSSRFSLSGNGKERHYQPCFQRLSGLTGHFRFSTQKSPIPKGTKLCSWFHPSSVSDPKTAQNEALHRLTGRFRQLLLESSQLLLEGGKRFAGTKKLAAWASLSESRAIPLVSLSMHLKS